MPSTISRSSTTSTSSTSSTSSSDEDEDDLESGESEVEEAIIVGDVEASDRPTVDAVVEPPAPPRRTFRQWRDDQIDGFKEHPKSRKRGAFGAAGRPPLYKNLKTIQLQFIAFGGAIGTGLFVGSGQALAAGGPGSLFLGFLIIGIDLLCTIYSLAEMTLVLPVTGAFVGHASRFINKPWGFAMGWNYAMQWLIVLPLELVALTIVFKYWSWAAKVPSGVLAVSFLFVIFVINLFGIRGYGHAEMYFAIMKITAVVGFFFLGLAIDLGAGTKGFRHFIGGEYWHNPGTFTGGWNGFFGVLVVAAFAFSGTEMVCLAAGEHPTPKKVLPKAVKRVFWRILLFYTLSVIVVGLVVPYTDPRLLDSTADTNSRASPFVIAIKNAGILALDSILNVVIMITVLSVGNTSVYASTRVLVALSVQNQAPKALSYIDRKGRPQVALAIAFLFGLLSILAQLHDNSTVFTWLLGLSGLSSIITWGSICLAHIRMRAACDAQGKTDRLPFISPFGIWGSYVGLVINCGVIVGQVTEVLLAIEWNTISTPTQMENSWSYFLAIPLFALCYWAYVVFERWSEDVFTMDLETRTKFMKPGKQRRRRVVKGPLYKKAYDILC